MGRRFVLVTEEWAGSGHRMAAQALAEELLRENVEFVRIVGGLETASPALLELSRFFYAAMLRYAPLLWQRIYEREKMWSKALKKPLGWWLSQRLAQQVLEREQPDVVVATHACCLAALARAKRSAARPFHLVSVPTDYHVNHFWVDPLVDTYIVAHEQLAEILTDRYQVSADKIRVHGIPVRPAFREAQQIDKPVWKSRLGLQPKTFTVLVSGGEGGYGGIEDVLQALVQFSEPLQVVVVTGKNMRLQEKLQAWLSRQGRLRHLVWIKGYEPQMWQWIGAADAYISKPGGISCAEALTLKTPIILYKPLPGQERQNSEFLQRNQAAAAAAKPADIRDIVSRWRDREVWEQEIEKMERLRRPEATREIAEYLLRL
ncbi:glycosyltransferase [Brevibacillus sp. GCM10020057]|uniref:MGDG synthase family glycosyltransferase n=1 Tax=Brevibacillus sp. GCM10020057 TaxID=3317327 RepID=UPI003642DB48